jgi:hypothetical protein
MRIVHRSEVSYLLLEEWRTPKDHTWILSCSVANKSKTFMHSSSGVFIYKCLERLATYAKVRVTRSKVHNLHIKQEKATTFQLDSWWLHRSCFDWSMSTTIFSSYFNTLPLELMYVVVTTANFVYWNTHAASRLFGGLSQPCQEHWTLHFTRCSCVCQWCLGSGVIAVLMNDISEHSCCISGFEGVNLDRT